MKAYQVINRHGYPASNEFNNVCAFPSIKEAEAFIDHLHEEYCLDEEFEIKIVYVITPELMHGLKLALDVAQDGLPIMEEVEYTEYLIKTRKLLEKE